MQGTTQSAEKSGDGEAARLQSLASYEILDTSPEAQFDDLARLAARLCNTPMAVITLVDAQRQWFKAAVGVGLRETPRTVAFCAHTIEGHGLFQVPDTLADARFAHNLLVTDEPRLRFYAGIPLQVEGGHSIGSLAVLDRQPRRLTTQQQTDLETLARQVVVLLEERRVRLLAETASAEVKRQSASMLAIAGRVARLGAWELDIERQKVVWSDVVADIHGMPSGYEPDVDRALSFYEKPSRSTLAHALDDCLHTGAPFDLELVLRRANDGAMRWVRSIGEAAHDASGRTTHLRGACQDITERKSHLLQIQRLVDRLSATLESIPDPFLAVGADWRVQLANAAFEQLVQRPRAQILGHSLAELLPDSAMQPRVLDRCQEAMNSRQPIEFEATDRRFGHRFEVRVFPVEDGLTVHARDITEREKTLAQLRLLDAGVRCLNDAVVITDANLEPPGPTIVFANQAAERLCGWQPNELVGDSPRRLQGRLTQRDRLDALRTALSTCRPFETELINYRRTGETYWVELKLSAIHDNAGRCTHFVAIERDITDRKLAEVHREGLETQLRQAQRMKSLGTLAGGIAHDFNNILGAILGNLSLVEDALPSDGPARAALATISSSAQRARSLVQQILAFGRQQPTQRQRQPLRPLVVQAVQLLQSTLPANVTLGTSFPGTEVFAEVDGNQLQQVLINLCTNASHAMPASGGRVEIGLDAHGPAPLQGAAGAAAGTAAPAPTPEWHAHLWVRDNGAGIDVEAQSRIFEPFFTTKPIGQGTGLGLSAAHGIVVAHGGSITVESEPGHGSVFHIHLPGCEPPPAQAAEPAAPATATRPARLDGVHVLCVDDDPVMLTTMQALLEREGCTVDAQLDAAQALERLRESPVTVHLLVTDYNMPDMDGMALVQAAKRLLPRLPVVMASGFLSDKLCEQATLLGVQALLQKERTVEDLVNTVRDVMARQTADNPAMPGSP